MRDKVMLHMRGDVFLSEKSDGKCISYVDIVQISLSRMQ